MDFPRDSLRESRRDGMAGQRPAPQGGEQVFSLSFLLDNFPEGNPEENSYLLDIGY